MLEAIQPPGISYQQKDIVQYQKSKDHRANLEDLVNPLRITGTHS